ncbi:MAG: hypothetical protein JXB48_09990 [Candidatus Latescibacteria bacterium]|nr:hypothetical protein [Candidatus Latescibacterota bacterium]
MHFTNVILLTLYVCKHINSIWDMGNEISDYLTDIINTQWKQKIQFRAVFQTPQVTVPLIEEACKSDTLGVRKISKILLAVRPAVNVRVHDELLAWLTINAK